MFYIVLFPQQMPSRRIRFRARGEFGFRFVIVTALSSAAAIVDAVLVNREAVALMSLRFARL